MQELNVARKDAKNAKVFSLHLTYRSLRLSCNPNETIPSARTPKMAGIRL